MGKLKLGIFGTGHLGRIIATAWKDGYLEEYDLVGVTGQNVAKTEALANDVECHACRDLDELLNLKPDYIAEAASVAAVRDNTVKILSSGCSMIVLSIGALADRTFYQQVKQAAADHGTRIHIASGAVGGFDVLRTVSLMGNAQAYFRTEKGPRSLMNSPVYEDHLITDTETTQVFSGNAAQAIALLPTRVNVAVAASLATTGPENIAVSINSTPGFIGDDHRITAEVPGARAVVDIYSSTSDIAGWSVVAALQNIVSPVVF